MSYSLLKPLLYFNGVSQAVTIANTNNRLQPSNTFTWEMWFKLESYTQYNTLMGFSSNNLDFGRMDAKTQFKCHTWDTNDAQTFVTPSGFPAVDDGKWHHMAIVWDGINGKRWGFIDGIQRYYATMAINSIIKDTSAFPIFTIGGANPTKRLINGWIKDVRMWQIARTQQEIIDNMNVNLIGDEDGLFLYLPLNEGKGNTVTDKASGFEANLNGTIWQKVDDMIPGVVWRYNDYYNTEDLNRVEANTQFIADLLSSMGYNAEIQLSDSDWSMLKFPTNAQINRIELNLESLKNSFYTPPGYGNMKVWPQKTRFSYEDANRYERNLELLYKWAKLIYESYKYCGTFACGEEVI